MTDTTSKPLPFNMARAFKPKDAFGDPRVFLNAMPKDPKGLPVDGTYVKMGVLLGKADGIATSKRENSQGIMEYFYGLNGTFEAMPVDPTKIAPTRTNKAWLPEELQHGIEQALSEYINHKTNEVVVNEGGADVVLLAFEVGCEASTKSSTGFIWRWRALVEVEAAGDPLSDLRAKLPAGSLPALEAPKHVVEETEGDVEAADLGDTAAEQAKTEAASGSAAVAASGRKAK